MIYLIALSMSAVVSALWVQGIDTMKVSESDYRGMDLFDEYDAQ
jgi:hypothetical protein